MLKKPLTLACVLLTAVLLAGASSSPGARQGKKLKIGVVFDYSGPLAAVGQTCTRSARRS